MIFIIKRGLPFGRPLRLSILPFKVIGYQLSMRHVGFVAFCPLAVPLGLVRVFVFLLFMYNVKATLIKFLSLYVLRTSVPVLMTSACPSENFGRELALGTLYGEIKVTPVELTAI